MLASKATNQKLNLSIILQEIIMIYFERIKNNFKGDLAKF